LSLLADAGQFETGRLSRRDFRQSERPVAVASDFRQGRSEPRIRSAFYQMPQNRSNVLSRVGRSGASFNGGVDIYEGLLERLAVQIVRSAVDLASQVLG
jgi:hypothetical protein